MNIILLTIKIEHSSFYGEDALLFIFIVTIDIFFNTNKCDSFICFIVRVINQRY